MPGRSALSRRVAIRTVQLSKTVGDLTIDITAEELARLKSDVAAIRHVFVEQGIAPDA